MNGFTGTMASVDVSTINQTIALCVACSTERARAWVVLMNECVLTALNVTKAPLYSCAETSTANGCADFNHTRFVP